MFSTQPRAAIHCLSFLLLVSVAVSANAQRYSNNGAGSYVRSNDYEGLVRYATAWSKAEPNNPNPWAFLGMTYDLHLHQPQKAIGPIQRSLQLNPKQPEGWHALGVAYIHLKQYSNAVQAIQKAIHLNPNQPTYWNNLAVAYTGEADWNNALKTLDQEQPLAARLNNARVWYVLGNGYLKLQNASRAVAAYQRCVHLQPNLSYCWTNMGVMLQWAGNNQGALQAYARGNALGDSLGGQDAARLKQAIVAQQRAASSSSGGRNMGQEAAFLNNAFRQEAIRASENRP